MISLSQKFLKLVVILTFCCFGFETAEAKSGLTFKAPKPKSKRSVSLKTKKTRTKKTTAKKLKSQKKPIYQPSNNDYSSRADYDAAVTVRNGRARIDFEDLIIQGQLRKSDTIYLFQRGENQLDSLVQKRENFRKEIYEEYLN